MINPNRLSLWSPEWRDDFALLQGTQRTYSSDKGELPLQQFSTEYHDVIEYRVKKKARGGQPEGVMMLLPRGARKLVKRVMFPTDKTLEGRALAVWLDRGLFSVCLITLYCPTGGRQQDEASRKKAEQLWNWVGMVRQSIPSRTRFILGTDANGHVGSVRKYTSEFPPA